MKQLMIILAVALLFNVANAEETKEERKARLVAELLKTIEKGKKLDAKIKEQEEILKAYKKLNKTAEKLVKTFENK